MLSPTAAGGLLPTGEVSIATRTPFSQPHLPLYSTEDTNSRKTRTPYALYDSSFFQMNNLPAAFSCRRGNETKSGENRMFDPGGSQGRLRASPFLGTWRALLCGEGMRAEAAGDDLQRFWSTDDSRSKLAGEGGEPFTPYVSWSIGFSPIQLVQKRYAVEGGSRLKELKGRTEVMPSMAARGYWKLGAIGCRGASWSEQLDGKQLRGAERELELSGFAVSCTPSTFSTHLPPTTRIIVLCWFQCVVMLHRCNTVILLPHMTL